MIDVKFKINSENIEYFSQIIKYDLATYLDEFNTWYKVRLPNLVGFYTGKLPEIDVVNFTSLRDLLNKSEEVTNNIIVNSHLFVGLLDMEMVEFFDEMKINLRVFNRLDKFLRSTQTNSSYTNKFEFNQTLIQNQTLENVVYTSLNTQDYNNEWVDVAMRNDLAEIDYTYEGGNSVVLSVNLNTKAMKITSVLDNIQGVKVLGLDAQKKIEFVNDDIKVLSYTDTIIQAVQILTDLMKGDIPEFLDMGRSGGVGDNLKSFAVNTIVRELIQTFSSDDTLTLFAVKKIRYNDAGAFFIEFSLSSRLDLTVNNQITV